MQYTLPLVIFVLMAALLGYGLTLDPKKVPSVFIDKPAPSFRLAKLGSPQQILSPQSFQGRVWVLNVWASWCVSCRAEHEVIKHLSTLKLVEIVGLNYKDKATDAQHWLQQFGDPYSLSLMDLDGKTGIDWGVYGVPETFIIGADGLIKYKHIGPITLESLEAEVIPVLQDLNR